MQAYARFVSRLFELLSSEGNQDQLQILLQSVVNESQKPQSAYYFRLHDIRNPMGFSILHFVAIKGNTVYAQLVIQAVQACLALENKPQLSRSLASTTSLLNQSLTKQQGRSASTPQIEQLLDTSSQNVSSLDSSTAKA